MNYLGHSIITTHIPEKDFGNIFGDFFKGNPSYLDLPKNIINGIILHRQLDSFVDNNNIYLKNTIFFKEYKLYKKILLDIYFDHFLAKNYQKLFNDSLKESSKYIFNLAITNKQFLSEENISKLNWLIKNNSLYYYKDIDFIKYTLNGISYRFKNIDLSTSIEIYKKNNKIIDNNFFEFFNLLTKKREYLL
ncbi:acyl carrier protein phosphodiesterase [Hypnocyclicus thermotrophus]|uniref:Acyl carrier protein phosphodiesterase n=1 Tax=Hypnocyclicus thermotrophus TaxID=1627895 RepID=A0AA46I5U1_9FUSO|nr:ACP phosphodiesterase [Hypnocyclicus thermotrophus]TDT71474.1 acyl carrier protein phosphodiesterase [Hypnocyclicus thermotrophus]